MPTIVMSRAERSGVMTPGSRHRSPGMSVSMSRIDVSHAGLSGTPDRTSVSPSKEPLSLIGHHLTSLLDNNPLLVLTLHEVFVTLNIFCHP